MANNKFKKLCLSSLVAVYFLIFIGGLVRSTGSGMGCPDWPRCFGSFVPPSVVTQLPENYKTIYAEYRARKNKRFANFLNFLGMKGTSIALLNDRSVLIETEFDPVKTRIEYINRLTGVLIGFMITALFIYSFKFEKRLRILSGLAWFSVVIAGWFGSIVVSSNLTPWTVTVHMVMALCTVALLIATYHYSILEAPKLMVSKLLAWSCFFLILIQFGFGVEVRESLEIISAHLFDRSLWISSLGFDFLIHRSFSWIIIGFNGYLIYRLAKTFGVNFLAIGLFVLLLGLVLSGTIMSYFSVPFLAQPVHLMLASITFGTLFLVVLRSNKIIL